MMVILIIIIICIVWFYTFLWSHPSYEKVRYVDIEPFCKSGDLILFHGLDSINAAFMGSYYTHVGVVYRKTPNTKPVLFEAWNAGEEILYPDEISHGISISDLENRVNSYRGYVFYKPLMNPISDEQNYKLACFMDWAYNNMHYNPQVIKNGAKKLLLNDSLTSGTNCGEITYLALVAIGCLNKLRLSENRKHHLRWICDLQKTDDGNGYMPIKYIWQNYFTLATI